MQYLVLASLMFVPALIAWIVDLLSGGRWLPPLLAATAVGALGGAFLFGAASAMATAVDDDAAMLRGAGIGAAGGLLYGLVVLGLLRFVRRRRTTRRSTARGSCSRR